MTERMASNEFDSSSQGLIASIGSKIASLFRGKEDAVPVIYAVDIEPSDRLTPKRLKIMEDLRRTRDELQDQAYEARLGRPVRSVQPNEDIL